MRLILRDLLQDRLAKLTEHAAHADVIFGAIAQHDLRVTPVTQGLQGQPVRALEPGDRSSSDCWSVTVRALVRRMLTERRYGIPPVGHPVDIPYSIRHFTPLYGQRSRPDAIIRRFPPDEAAMERANNLTARQWEAWMNEAYRPSFNVAPS